MSVGIVNGRLLSSLRAERSRGRFLLGPGVKIERRLFWVTASWRGSGSSFALPARGTAMRRVDPRKLTRWYDFQARLYRLCRNRFGRPLVRGVAERLGQAASPAAVLDAGCGTGLLANGLAASHAAWRVQALDASRGMIAEAAKQSRSLGLSNVSFLQGDVTAMPYGEAVFDTIVAAGLFSNLNEALPALREFHRVLKPGGQLVVVEYDRDTMTFGVRLFFRAMILGYGIVSALFRRFRFAEGWDISASTIDRREFELDLEAAAFRGTTVDLLDSNLIFHRWKGSGECRNS